MLSNHYHYQYIIYHYYVQTQLSINIGNYYLTLGRSISKKHNVSYHCIQVIKSYIIYYLVLHIIPHTLSAPVGVHPSLQTEARGTRWIQSSLVSPRPPYYKHLIFIYIYKPQPKKLDTHCQVSWGSTSRLTLLHLPRVSLLIVLGKPV